MATSIDFKTPNDIATQYLEHLKALKPSVNTNQTDSDWFIRSQVVGGVMSGVYADLRKISDDAFPQSARHEALNNHLVTYFGEGFIQPTVSKGVVLVEASATGVSVASGLEMTYTPNGNVYQVTENTDLGDAVTGTVPVQSVGTGQAQNLLEGAILNISSPPPGLMNTATVFGGNISDGRDQETDDEAATRILDRIRQPPSGGTANDYKTFAKSADPAVTDANVIRYLFGLGTVGIVITAGTTDIDTALNNGQPVIRVPSDALVQEVQDTIRGEQVLTDCVHVLKPSLVTVNVTVRVRFTSGDGNTIPSGQLITQKELVQREVKRAIYKTPPGGRQFGGTGFVVASEIEEVIDIGLADTPYEQGSYTQILLDRQVDDLSVSGSNRMILATELAEPGTINVVEM